MYQKLGEFRGGNEYKKRGEREGERVTEWKIRKRWRENSVIMTEIVFLALLFLK